MSVLFALIATVCSAVPGRIERIDLVHFSHTDYGYTDHPAVCREMQQRYLDIALDAIQATRGKTPAGRFAWTAETTVAVLDWWRSADAARRQAFLEAVRSGQLEVSALPLNNTPCLDRRQWSMMTHWLPDDLWRQFHPQAALQSDVNGFPRAGAMALLDRQIRYLFTSINEYCGGAPLARPSAFWWKMPDGRRMLVYLNYSYPAGYGFFEANDWRRGPVPRAGDSLYRPPHPGEVFAADEASVRRAHRLVCQRVGQLEKQGYAHRGLILSTTNRWRIDNDPPFPSLADFAATWSRLGLKPELHLTTVSGAMRRLEQEAGDQLPEHSGEWPDWWANGAVSSPREVAASRRAKRLLGAAESPLFGPLDARAAGTSRAVLEDLCLFDEHTWGASDSVGLPYDLDVQGQFVAKAAFAYRPMARAEWFLSQRLRSRLATAEEGLYVANPTDTPWSGWIEMRSTALREDYRSVEDPASGWAAALEFRPGYAPWVRPQSPSELSAQNTSETYADTSPRQTARFWLDRLPGRTLVRLRLSTKSVEEAAAGAKGPEIRVDRQGWPQSAQWPGMSKPLFEAGTGQLTAFRVGGFAARWKIPELYADHRPAKLDKFRRENLQETPATAAAPAEVRENRHTRLYVQTMCHPRLRWAERQLELWKSEPRARLTLRFYRTSLELPEALVASFTLPCADVLPRASCGGQPFVPFADQLPGTCRDYFAIDGCVGYTTGEGNWYWWSRDCPLVSFGSPAVFAFPGVPPRDAHRIHAQLFNNFWSTNFVADSSGVMEFRFDLAWSEKQAQGPSLGVMADALGLDPPVAIVPRSKPDPIVVERLFRP
jgi:hypothetical protein